MPYYETNTDIEVALNAADNICKKYLTTKYKIHHFKKASPIDIGISFIGPVNPPLALYDSPPQQQTILFEHKRRNHDFGTYKTIWLSLSKYDLLSKIKYPVIPLFGVTWKNAIGFINIGKVLPINFSINKRIAGNRVDDTYEVVAEFDIKDFEIL